MPITVTENRAKLRATRYKHLRALGFSVADAAKYRDQSATHIVEFTEEETQRITEKKSNVRSKSEAEILRRARYARRSGAPPTMSPRLKPIQERVKDFSNWTRDGFPDEALDYIKQVNKDQGLSPVDSYGYRRFWHMYVDNQPASELHELADRGESEVRE